MSKPHAQCRKHLLIAGRVQGVGYRYSMYTVAQQLKLAGGCRNLPDGRVEALVEGPEDVVDQLISWCHQGPPMASVTEVLAKDLSESETPLPNPFEIWR